MLSPVNSPMITSSGSPGPGPSTVLTPAATVAPSFSASAHDDMEPAWTESLLPRREPTAKFLKEKNECLNYFHGWSEQDQIDFVEDLLTNMCHYQHGTVNAFLKPMLQRDFITLLPKKGLDHVAETILSYLDAKSLCAAELVRHPSPVPPWNTDDGTFSLAGLSVLAACHFRRHVVEKAD